MVDLTDTHAREINTLLDSRLTKCGIVHYTLWPVHPPIGSWYLMALFTKNKLRSISGCTLVVSRISFIINIKFCSVVYESFPKWGKLCEIWKDVQCMPIYHYACLHFVACGKYFYHTSNKNAAILLAKRQCYDCNYAPCAIIIPLGNIYVLSYLK